MPRPCKSGKLFAVSETSFLQFFPLDSRREGLRERGWVIICRYFEKKETTYFVGRLYLLSFFPRNSLKEWGVPSLHHLKARPAFLLRLDYLPLPSVSLPFFLWQIFLPRCRMTPWRLFPRKARTTKATSRSKSLHRIKERLQTKPSFLVGRNCLCCVSNKLTLCLFIPSAPGT